jgi:hypothetical protein
MNNMNSEDVTKIYSFDGQSVWQDRDTELYEVGNFLGGGAAGTGTIRRVSVNWNERRLKNAVSSLYLLSYYLHLLLFSSILY